MKLLVVIGTRPEAIKMAPLIKKLGKVDGIVCKVCNTGQHKDLLNPILDFFKTGVDYSLDVMLPKQSLHQLTANIITNIRPVFEEYLPDYVLVHGDTTTSFAVSLAAFYSGIKVAHVEAGLRTFNKLAPFPEEINRSLTARLADVHFAPTPLAAQNLAKEGITQQVIVTGNTVIDALYDAIRLINEGDDEIVKLKQTIDFSKKLILFTGHRRENFGAGFEQIFEALKELTENRDDVQIVYPVHPNPNVKLLAEKYFADSEKIKLIAPLSYGPFTWLMQQSYLIMTDSGGIQEEAPSLGKPVLVLREVTERPEAVEAGTVSIVGTDKEKIKALTLRLLDDTNFYQEFSRKINPYGDGKASERIADYFVSLCSQHITK
jgi:UDP-N-acetylglucosamine 2-epimerase (non-hydrolysing)